MDRKQLIALVVTTFGVFLTGGLLIVLLPVYAVQLGMDEGSIGLYFTLGFVAITIGALSSGWLANRLRSRKLIIIITCVLGIPGYILMGQVSNLLVFTLITLITWFWAGAVTAVINILVGANAAPHQRGRIFGITATTISLANVIGGFAAGGIVLRWGYSGLFTISALIWVIPLVAILFVQDNVTPPEQASQSKQEQQPKASPIRLSRAFWLLLLANTLAGIALFGGNFARPLMMNSLNFDASAISGASGFANLIALPLPFLLAWSSDRAGRKPVLIAGYGVATVGILLMLSAVDMWQFWLSATLLAVAGTTGAVATALATDLTTPETLNTAMSRFSATPWIAGIFGYGATGIVLQAFGASPTLLIGAVLPVVAIIALQLSSRKTVPPITPAFATVEVDQL